RRSADRVHDSFQVVVLVPVVAGSGVPAPELGGGHAGPENAVRPNVSVLDGQAAESGLEGVEGEAQVEERAQDHVAGRAREAVEIQHHQSDRRLPFACCEIDAVLLAAASTFSRTPWSSALASAYFRASSVVRASCSVPLAAASVPREARSSCAGTPA